MAPQFSVEKRTSYTDDPTRGSQTSLLASESCKATRSDFAPMRCQQTHEQTLRMGTATGYVRAQVSFFLAVGRICVVLGVRV